MNEEKLRNNFRQSLSDLIQEIGDIIQGGERNAYTDNSAHSLHEHDTRTLFIDRFLILLGWRLDAKGNVSEEARIKGDTTRFIDYVGVSKETRTPLMILEAKAWDKPFVSAREIEKNSTDEDLIAAAIRHISDEKPEDESPVTNQWYEYLKQVHGYVKTMKERYGHDTPRAILSSGQWLVIFTQPVLTFVEGGGSANNIKIFKLDEYKNNSDELFTYLHYSTITNDIPSLLRPAQLRKYIHIDFIKAVFYGLHVHFEKTGSQLYCPRPRILVYPALILQRIDDAFITITNGNKELTLNYTKNSENTDDLTVHLEQVTDNIKELHQACEDELDDTLSISSLSQFPGFPGVSFTEATNSPQMVKRINGEANEWLVLTGTEKHYLRNTPVIHSCLFHSWSACHLKGCAKGTSAISTPSTDPHIIFIDTQIHHCAHQEIFDRKERKCHIFSIDEQVCCQVCHYFSQCWSPAEQAKLPCGGT
ncbi:hypothetical protein RIN66_04075 [Hafnia alvei]|uniref:hypothetical protein n=1 Tax=Hafnia alvei TaxID=569 RepID=UPI0028BF2842|nr:hypothetical protein [Hafnia alvei]WNN53248.1 hypothetical protein RIN66_04075 [Hafnia alvei]